MDYQNDGVEPLLNDEIKQYIGADEIKNYEAEWNVNGTSYFSGIKPEDWNTNPVFIVKQNPTGFTIGQLVSRLLKKSYTKKETFWVELTDQYIYCYDPCPADGDCCTSTPIYDYYLPRKNTENSERTPISVKKYLWFTWRDYNDITLVQDFSESTSFSCGALETSTDTNDKQPDFFRENCESKHRPLCMRWSNIQIIPTRRKRKNPNKKKPKNGKKKISMKGKGSSGRQGRQLTDTGRPIEMCATVLPALIGNNKQVFINGKNTVCNNTGVCYFWPSLCSDSENVTTTEQTTEVPDYYDGGDYEEYDYDNYGNFVV